jgi:hypothetical protein
LVEKKGMKMVETRVEKKDLLKVDKLAVLMDD